MGVTTGLPMLRTFLCLYATIAAAAAMGQVAAPVGPSPHGAPIHPAAQVTQALARRILLTNDHAGLPFAIVDKRAATVIVYHNDGSPAGFSNVLLGRALGDQSAAGVGERTQTRTLRAQDRTTPAGKFASAPGRNLAGEAVVWVDYSSAFSIHRLRPGPGWPLRVRQLASPVALERRLSDGCVVVPEAFYLAVIAPVLGQGRAWVYVLPEAGAWEQIWPELAAPQS